mmetsp:Transcript_12089/g.34968  ORF Transcript_12089/g.34968 Transcript_12089/m.34968 type:complete len:312 (-) Transcript_12089:465-1400(-)
MLFRTAILALLATGAAALGSGSQGGADWRYFVAGGVSAATSHGITTPIDVVKTRMQIEPQKYKGSVLTAAKDLVKEEGPLFLLQGLAPTVFGYGIEGALKFGFYELFKPIFGNLTPNQFVNFLLASVVAGAVASVVLCPAEDARIRMVSDPSFANGMLGAIGRLIREEGFASTFAGLTAMLGKQVPYTMTKQVSFDVITSIFYTFMNELHPSKIISEDLKLAITFGSAAITSVLACIASQPGDVVLTETYKSHGAASTGAIINNIYKTRGTGGFFVGINARLVHVGGIITSQLAIYDYVKQGLGLAATGSH